MNTTSDSRQSADNPGRTFAMTTVVGVAAFAIGLAAAKSIADIIGPVFLALVLTISLHPIRTWLERHHRVPKWSVSILTLVAAYLLLFALTLALIVSVAQLAALVPEYSDQINAGIENAGNSLKDLGVQQDQINVVTSSIDPGKIVDFAQSLLSNTLAVLGNVFFLLTVLLFVTFDTDSTRQGFAALGKRFPGPVAAVNHFADGTRNYMGVSAGFGFIVAVIDGTALWLMGVPGAFVWGVLAFVTNFIPNIGFIIGVIPPAIIAQLEGGPGLMVAVIVVYAVVNFLIQSVIQPRVVGDEVGLTPSFTFMSLVFWTWVVGPLGALLAVPLTLLTKALLVEADPRTRWALPLISGKPEPDEQPKSEPAGQPEPRPQPG